MNMSNGWKYYNHAYVPENPYVQADISLIENEDIWQSGVYFARWVTDFDCGHETEWWYVIKDEPFDISSLKAKRRYEINKGIKNFEVKIIDPREYKEELYNAQLAMLLTYPPKYRPTVNKEEFFRDIDTVWDRYIIFGAFFREMGELKGYALLTELDDGYIEFNVLKTFPEYEKYGINAALIEGMLTHFSDFLARGGIISDGARNVSHETNFQDYLEKYFGFRKAYCNLHIKYNPKLKALIKVMYRFRHILKRLDSIRKIHGINSLLRLEEIARGK